MRPAIAGRIILHQRQPNWHDNPLPFYFLYPGGNFAVDWTGIVARKGYSGNWEVHCQVPVMLTSVVRVVHKVKSAVVIC